MLFQADDKHIFFFEKNVRKHKFIKAVRKEGIIWFENQTNNHITFSTSKY